jgi:hypothetical protein
MRKFTDAEKRILSDALTTGTVYAADRRIRQGRHSRHILQRLWAQNYLNHVPGSMGRFPTMSHYVLTDEGRTAALQLPDREGSASRQHFIDTGRYLPYSAREEFNPSAFAVGDLVRRSPAQGLPEDWTDGTIWKVIDKRWARSLWLYDVELSAHADGNTPVPLYTFMTNTALGGYVKNTPAPPPLPVEVRRINTRKEFLELKDELGMRDDWHEPDETDVDARVLGQSFDNAGFWPQSDSRVIPDEILEMHVVFTKDGKDVAAVNLATLCAWASQ